jgi:hypothetical protein
MQYPFYSINYENCKQTYLPLFQIPFSKYSKLNLSPILPIHPQWLPPKVTTSLITPPLNRNPKNVLRKSFPISKITHTHHQNPITIITKSMIKSARWMISVHLSQIGKMGIVKCQKSGLEKIVNRCNQLREIRHKDKQITPKL